MTANSGSAGKNELITIIFDRVSWPKIPAVWLRVTSQPEFPVNFYRWEAALNLPQCARDWC